MARAERAASVLNEAGPLTTMSSGRLVRILLRPWRTDMARSEASGGAERGGRWVSGEVWTLEERRAAVQGSSELEDGSMRCGVGGEPEGERERELGTRAGPRPQYRVNNDPAFASRVRLGGHCWQLLNVFATQASRRILLSIDPLEHCSSAHFVATYPSRLSPSASNAISSQTLVLTVASEVLRRLLASDVGCLLVRCEVVGHGVVVAPV